MVSPPDAGAHEPLPCYRRLTELVSTPRFCSWEYLRPGAPKKWVSRQIGFQLIRRTHIENARRGIVTLVMQRAGTHERAAPQLLH
jgi:hypothetical protein